MAAAHEATSTLVIGGERQLVIGGLLGTGSQGSVHVGRLEQSLGDDVLARAVAVKILRCPEPRDVFRSLRRVALVRHPNVVQVTDVLEGRDEVYVVQDLVEGMDLGSFMARWRDARRRMPLELALFIACEVAEGLSGARMARVSHHDLSARQVLLSWHGEVKVGDFGRRNTGDVASGVRRASTDVRSRVAHLSPEVARGGRGDARSDVFSLGVLLHEMLYGPRFARDLPTQDVLEMTREGVVPTPVLRPVMPSGIEDVLARAVEIDPRARQEHAGVVAYDLRREALALGVGDARVFLRSALFDLAEGGHDAES